MYYKETIKELLGSFLYLSTHTRPDITFSVNLLRPFLEAPLQVRWIDAKCILRYLVGTNGHGSLVVKVMIIHKRTYKTDSALFAFSNSD